MREPNRPNFRPFFIIGSGRSGTTMLRLMLNAHSRLGIPGESWFLSDLMDQLPLQDILDEDQVETALHVILSHWRWKEWQLSDATLAETLRSLHNPRLADLIDAMYCLTIDNDDSVRWGDKTPGYAREVNRLHDVFGDAQFIHIIRDGRDVCLSMKRTGWSGEATWSIANAWRTDVMGACVAGRSLSENQYQEVHYEDLVSDTEGTLRKITKFLGVEFEPSMLDFHSTARANIPERAHGHLQKTFRAPQPTDVRRWEREQKALQTAIFEAFAGDALDAAGYRRRFTHRLGLLRAACQGLEWLATTSLPLRNRLGLHFPNLRQSL